jgi:voltage-gated potassium channel
MVAFYLLTVRFVRSLWAGMKDAEFRALFYWVLAMLGLGTWFYSFVEGWRPLDAFYFTITTLATVGFGDFAPKTDIGKIFTSLYIIVGIGLLSAFVVLLAERIGVAHRPAKKKR